MTMTKNTKALIRAALTGSRIEPPMRLNSGCGVTTPAVQMFTVPNNLRGRLFVWFLASYLNRQRYRLTVRGRSLKPGRQRGWAEIHRADAEIWGVYVQEREAALNEDTASKELATFRSRQRQGVRERSAF